MSDPRETRSGELISAPGIGRPLADESITAFLEIFDKVMPSEVGIDLRQLPGAHYVGHTAFSEYDPSANWRNRSAVEVKIGGLVTKLYEERELSSSAFKPVTPTLNHFNVVSDSQLVMRIQDRNSFDYTNGFLITGERAAFTKALNIPQRQPKSHRAEDRPPMVIVTLGKLKGNKQLVTNDGLNHIRRELREVRLESVGLVTSR
jgi:hypothetical protein